MDVNPMVEKERENTFSILVIYYSYEGNTEQIAKVIANKLNADVLFLKPVKEMTSKGFTKFLWGGRQVVLKKKPELKPLKKNPLDYDVLVIGTPVWAYTFTPPLRTFFGEIPLKGKKIALFCTHEGGPRKTLNKMADQVSKGNIIIGKKDFWNLTRGDKKKEILKAKEWAKHIKNKLLILLP